MPKLDMYHILHSYAVGLPGIELQMRGGPPQPTWLLEILGSSQVRVLLCLRERLQGEEVGRTTGRR